MRSLRASVRRFGLAAAALALVLDQGTKALLLYGFGLAHMGPAQNIAVLPFLNLVMLWNPGISYSLFPAGSPEETVLLATFQLLAVCGLTWWMWSVRSQRMAVSLGLVIGGALGNLTDRLAYGAVADFIHFFAFGHDFYVFNVADAAITLGVLGMLYDMTAMTGRYETNSAGDGN